MKRILLAAAIAMIALSSCQKEQDYLCTVETGNAEALVSYYKDVVPFHGTYTQMKQFEADRTFGIPWVTPLWQSCHCR